MDKIVTTVKIKKCEIIEGKLEFDKLSLTSDECKQIKIWHDYGESLQIALQSVQPELFSEASEVCITKESSFNEESAIVKLISEVATRMRERMLDKLSDGLKGWDDEDCLEGFKERAAAKVEEGDWIDALNYIVMIWNLEKPLEGQSEEEPKEAEPSLLEGQEAEPEPAII